MSAENWKLVWRRAVALLVTTAMLFGSTFFIAPRAQALLSPEQLAIRDGLKQVSDALAGLDGLDELAQTLPLSNLLPTEGAGLDVVDSVKAVLDDAIALLESGAPIALVFSDIVMPGGMTGYDVAERVRSMKPDLKVLLTSGYSDLGVEVGKTARDAKILGKPYTRAQLACALREALNS